MFFKENLGSVAIDLFRVIPMDFQLHNSNSSNYVSNFSNRLTNNGYNIIPISTFFNTFLNFFSISLFLFDISFYSLVKRFKILLIFKNSELIGGGASK
ncbi:MAG: hypothetical protein FWH29_10685 [Methanobrevibacter sp.]|nr:hypothetical protein [Methanobrevibacter sp.]